MSVRLTALAIAALVPVGIASSAHADPTVFSINSFTSSSDGSPVENFTVANYAWETTNYIDFLDDGLPATFNIEVNSGQSTRPGWDYEITFNYAAYDIGFFLDGTGPGIHQLTLNNIKDENDPNAGVISDVVAKDAFGNEIGTVGTNGYSIIFETTVEAVLNNGNFITIQFNQIPAPGGLALLAVAGFGGRGRRRR